MNDDERPYVCKECMPRVYERVRPLPHRCMGRFTRTYLYDGEIIAAEEVQCRCPCGGADRPVTERMMAWATAT